MKSNFFGALTLYLFPICAMSAPSGNLIRCTNTSTQLYMGCSLSTDDIGTSEDYGFDSKDLIYRYAYDCANGPGAGRSVSLKSDTGNSEAFRYTEPGETAVIKINTRGPVFLYNPDPVRFSRAKFPSTCSLQLKLENVYPSMVTIGHWQEIAKLRSKILRNKLESLMQVERLMNVIVSTDDSVKIHLQTIRDAFQNMLPDGKLFEELVYPSGEKQGWLRDASDMPAWWEKFVLENEGAASQVLQYAQVQGLTAANASLLQQAERDAILPALREDLANELSDSTKLLESWKKYEALFDAEMKRVLVDFKNEVASARN